MITVPLHQVARSAEFALVDLSQALSTVTASIEALQGAQSLVRYQSAGTARRGTR